LSRLAGSADKITAQAVRVVNFDEAGFGGLGGGVGGAGGAGLPLPGTKGGGKKGLLSGMHLGDIGKQSKGAAAGLQGVGVAAGVVGAALAGWQIGRAVDETFGLSKAFSDQANKSKEQLAISRLQLKQDEASARVFRAQSAAKQFAAISAGQGGFGFLDRGRGKKEALTRESAQLSIRRKFLQAGGDIKNLPAILAQNKALLDKIPTKEEFVKAGKPLEIKLVLDGKVITKTTTTNLADVVKRGGKFRHKPGTTRNKLTGVPQ
jgi:hypothetical protein